MEIEEVVINTEFPNEAQSSIIKQIGAKWKNKVVHVSEFKRYGYSGARLILLYFAEKPEGNPFLIKIAKMEDISSEHEGIHKMMALCGDCCQLGIDKIFSYDDSGALLYRHQGTDRPDEAKDPLTLSKVLYSEDKEFSEADLKKSIEVVYQKLENAHKKAKILDQNVLNHFIKYFREHKSRDQICNILGDLATEERFNFMGEEIYNPLKLIDNLLENVKLHVGCVHGDLHPDNIVIDRYGTPNLIDFAWANENRDILVDFVLLENSIRFMHFPRIAFLEEQGKVDYFLLEENGWEKIESIVFTIEETKRVYSRLACMVGTIRQMARRVLREEFSMQKYLFTQFIVLYGLLRFDGYERFAATRALGMMAKILKETEFFA